MQPRVCLRERHREGLVVDKEVEREMSILGPADHEIVFDGLTRSPQLVRDAYLDDLIQKDGVAALQASSDVPIRPTPAVVNAAFRVLSARRAGPVSLLMVPAGCPANAPAKDTISLCRGRCLAASFLASFCTI